MNFFCILCGGDVWSWISGDGGAGEGVWLLSREVVGGFRSLRVWKSGQDMNIVERAWADCNPSSSNRNCKARKVKCGEEKPRCSNCERLDEDCDYKIRLSWGGRPLKSKKQALENGGSSHDPNVDDQSQFIPGAGQFSINSAHFPAPQTFVQASNANGSTRKPPVPRVGGGKKSNMSTYQTVFAVGEVPQPSPPPQTPPTSSAPGSAATAPPVTGIPQWIIMGC